MSATQGFEGFGADTKGGYAKGEPQIVIVDSLADSGKGTLRAAIEMDCPRVVRFAVAGLIKLESKLRIGEPYISIEGQSAPYGGICLKDYPLIVETEEVIVQHLRSRLGDGGKGGSDSITIQNSHHVVFDHCSASWSEDECFSVINSHHITIQYCIIAEALNHSHHQEGHGVQDHSMGSILEAAHGGISLHHCIYASNRTRNPKPSGVSGTDAIVDLRNNVIYNWGDRASYTSRETEVDVNYIANYLKPGPSSKQVPAILVQSEKVKVFITGNIMIGNEEGTKDNRKLVKSDYDGTVVDQEFPVPPVHTEDAAEAYKSVLENAGATLPRRDAVDARIVAYIQEGKGKIIDSQKEVGGWPEYGPKAP
jgi:hypothetical protein